MTNKLVSVDIVRIHPRFDGESSHLLGIGMENLQLFQLGMRMDIEMYISRYNTRSHHISILV